MKGKNIYTCTASVVSVCIWTQKMCRRNSKDDGVTALPWEKLCPLPETILRGEDRDGLQWHQSANLTQTSTSLVRLRKKVTISSRPQRICLVRVRFASLYRMFCWRRYLWMGSVFPHYVTGVFISPTPEKISTSCLIYSTTNIGQPCLDLHVTCPHPDLYWALRCLIHEYFSLHVKCLVSHSRGKYYFVNQRHVTRWCKNRSSKACGFIQGQPWRNALEEQM